MYINFWYPVATSEEVTNENPVRATILTLNFVAFRDIDGKAHVLSDTCIHRGGSLGKGKLHANCIECPYHGWRYAGDGNCVLIPSLGDDEKLPARAKVDSYPVEEKYGIVFAFLGNLPEAERPPVWQIDECEQEEWRVNKLVVFEVDYFYERSMENGLDAAHNEFVHPNQGAPGLKQDFKNKPIEVEEINDGWGCGFIVPFGRDAEGLMGKEKGAYDLEHLKAGSGHLGPNMLVTWLQFTQENKFHQYFFEAPIDEHRTRIFFLNLRHFLLEPEHDQSIIDVNMQIAQEDIDVLVELNPVRTPDTTTRELLVPADAPVLRYREFLKSWDANGWRIDIKKLNELRGDVAFAIPCPARGTSKNWILDPIPTL